jgi:hypothetical protein
MSTLVGCKAPVTENNTLFCAINPNGNNSNNNIENLRPATVPQNQWNRKLDSSNTSGIKGVCWDKNTNKWISYVRKHGKNVYLGRFDTIQEAEKAVKIGRTTLHGEFARHE